MEGGEAATPTTHCHPRPPETDLIPKRLTDLTAQVILLVKGDNCLVHVSSAEIIHYLSSHKFTQICPNRSNPPRTWHETSAMPPMVEFY
jgi:hypothetical protein